MGRPGSKIRVLSLLAAAQLSIASSHGMLRSAVYHARDVSRCAFSPYLSVLPRRPANWAKCSTFRHAHPLLSAPRPRLLITASAVDDIDDDREERNEMIAEAYVEVAQEVRKKNRPVVEVVLDVPDAWWKAVVEPRLDRVAAAASLEPGKRVLDVGTGVGTMIGFASAEGRAKQNDVVGIDLCGDMLDIATERNPDAAFVVGDLLDMSLDDLQEEGTDEDVDDQAQELKKFDAVFFNAVFGSMPYQEFALSKAAELCDRGAKVIISHPLGAGFVRSLNQQDDIFTPNCLPSAQELSDMIQFLPFSVAGEVVDEEEFYLAVLERTPHQALEQVLCMRGPVATGYGRGGKKLGVPTANLPESLFSDALKDVRTGVYCGWASLDLDGEKSGPHKAVVNVGYSPTFVGEENREKIVEAHLLSDIGEDFYGQEMRLILNGFLRPEAKFPSFDKLLAAIKQDIGDADVALKTNTLGKFAKHPYLRKNSGLAKWMVSDFGIAFKASM